jgi:hypothetical protein
MAVLWMQGKLSWLAVRTALKIGGGSNAYNFLSVALREAYKRGLIATR